jgi:acyl-CoA synthetase (AMP-forming)/AMP-acid ligase II
MTETSRSIQNSELPRCLELRAFGRPRPPLEVRVVDDDDNPLPFNTPGELLVRASGPDPRMGFFSGYLNLPEETERAWRGGWFHTGDVVRQREDGILCFVDRRKNIIRRSGENIAAAEVEEALLDLPDVKGAAALAVSDDLYDEEVMACIVLMPGVERLYATAERLLNELRGKLGNNKLPGWIAFLDELPVTGTQKIQKGLLFPTGQDPRTDPRTFDLREGKRSIRLAELADKQPRAN